eukprot:108700-Prorocentrum_minimum.AAC.2
MIQNKWYGFPREADLWATILWLTVVTKLEQQNAELMMLLEERNREIGGLRWVRTGYHVFLVSIRTKTESRPTTIKTLALAGVKAGAVNADDLISSEAHGARIAELSKKVRACEYALDVFLRAIQGVHRSPNENSTLRRNNLCLYHISNVSQQPESCRELAKLGLKRLNPNTNANSPPPLSTPSRPLNNLPSPLQLTRLSFDTHTEETSTAVPPASAG